MTTTLRPETPADADAIRAVTEAAFRDAPHADHTEHLIVDALRRAGALTLSLVALEEGEVVGHVAVSPVTVSDGSAGWFGIGPLSVRPDRQRRGLGGRLMQEALRRLRAQGAAGCVLVGDPAYYARFGFEAAAGLDLPGVPAKYLLAQSLGAGRPRGTLAYHEAFGIQA